MQIVPRPLGHLLGDAMNALARVWRPLISTALWVFVPIGLVTMWVFEATDATRFLRLVFEDPERLAALDPSAFLDEALPFIQAAAVAFALQAIGAIYVHLAAARLIVGDAAGRRLAGREVRRFALRRYGTGMFSALVVGLAIAAVLAIGIAIWSIPATIVGLPNATSALIALALFALLAAPGIWLTVSASMFLPVLGAERKGPIGAIRRSFTLVRDRWWPTLGYLLLVGMLGFVAVQLIQLVAIPLTAMGDLGIGVSLASALGIAAQGVIIAGYGAMYAMWYLDLRSRSESLTEAALSPDG